MTQHFILGGYTKRQNQGISALTFEESCGQLGQVQLIDYLSGPTYIALNSDKTRLFALNQSGDQAGVVAYQQTNEGWERLAECYNTQKTGCHMVFRDSSQTLYVANYHEGALNSYQFTSDNQLKPLQRIERTGSSIHPQQTTSHLHYVGLDRTDQVLYVCDLGADLVISYTIDEKGWLTIGSELALQPGAGPRHLTSHPQLNELYAIGELDTTITLIEEGKGGILFAEAEVPTIAPDLVEQAAAAAIRLSQDGRFLYTSIRYHNVLVVFEIDETGQLKKIQEIDSHGQTPRDFILDDTERYLLVPHQDSDYIAVFERDSTTGLLTFSNADCYAPECVCIVHA